MYRSNSTRHSTPSTDANGNTVVRDADAEPAGPATNRSVRGAVDIDGGNGVPGPGEPHEVIDGAEQQPPIERVSDAATDVTHSDGHQGVTTVLGDTLRQNVGGESVRLYI